MKTIYTFEDLIERLAEQAVGTEVMKEVEEFCQCKQKHIEFLKSRLQKSEELLGSYMLDEHMMYE